MKRKIIEIDEERCTGCGICVSACAEAAIAIVDGKAVVVKDEYCDGLGDCIGECPESALHIVEREAPDFDPVAVEEHLHRLGAVAPEHTPPEAPLPCGCPGSSVTAFAERPAPTPPPTGGMPPQVNPSELSHFPVQLHLVPPQAPFYQDRELVVLSTCAPVASADVHWRFLRGRSVVVACPKLDKTGPYAAKLAAILAHNRIPRVQVVRMEVPCCGGLTHLVQQARDVSGRQDLEITEVVVGRDGAVRAERAA